MGAKNSMFPANSCRNALLKRGRTRAVGRELHGATTAAATTTVLVRRVSTLSTTTMEKDEKISAQKNAIKEALKKLSKNITNEDVTNFLTQIGLLADHMVAQAKHTVAGMEPYSFRVKLADGRKLYIFEEQLDVERAQTVAYYELMFDAELKKVERCFAAEKSNELQNALKRANPELFERIYKQFLSIATFTFLINELKLNKEEFFQRYSSTDGGQTYALKKSYIRMIDDNQIRIEDHRNAKKAKEICGLCRCALMRCMVVREDQTSKLEKKQHKLNRLSEAQNELISKNAGKSHLN
ncbi:hypothetical protein GPALN_010302 [Globodera pallida]|nr:hypothetical protein GPALN_010302 [Globodera pallida]